MRSGELKTKRQTWGNFRHQKSPRYISLAIAIALALRIALGGWSWRDAVAAGVMTVVYPFGEWAIHVYLLHLKPFEFRGRMVELPTAYAHREHHERPNHMGLILLGPVEVAGLCGGAVPLVCAPLLFLGVGPAITGVLTSYVLIFGYEWMHFLIHTSYRPKSALYRAVWRNHRLHHFKNEHFWHGVTNTIADHVLRTSPDHHAVPKSETARTL